MDYIKRQGRTKLKVSIAELRRTGAFEEIEQPDVVYHMTDKENLESILADGKIKTFNDYLSFFFPDTKSIPIYIQISGALIGREYYGTDGMIHRAPPLDIENTVVLKLVPRGKENLEWYREIGPLLAETGSEQTPENVKLILDAFARSRIVHYGNFRFRTDSVEIINLRDIYDNMPQDVRESLELLESCQSAQ